MQSNSDDANTSEFTVLALFPLISSKGVLDLYGVILGGGRGWSLSCWGPREQSDPGEETAFHLVLLME